MTKPNLTLLFDPLCGWCYGAQPALTALDTALAPDWTFLPTGMFSRPMPMSPDRAAYFWQNDQRIAQLTGQIFSNAYRERILANTDVPFDSTRATLAWLLIHQAKPAAGLSALHRIQALRYVDGVHHTPEHLSSLAAEYGLDPAQVADQLRTGGWPPFASQLFGTAQELMQRHRISGVPALLLGETPVPSQYLYQPQALVDYAHSALAKTQR